MKMRSAWVLAVFGMALSTPWMACNNGGSSGGGGSTSSSTGGQTSTSSGQASSSSTSTGGASTSSSTGGASTSSSTGGTSTSSSSSGGTSTSSSGGGSCTFTTCADCTAASSCGFCTNSNVCRTGTGAGATDNSCGRDAGTWAWLGTQCPGYDAGPDPCLAERDCQACVSDWSCGYFCPTDNTCVGSPGNCTAAGGYIMDDFSCPGYDAGPDPCPAHNAEGCYACLSDYSCNAYCMDGTNARTCQRAYNGCGDAGKITYSLSCPDYDAGPDPCLAHNGNGCTACLSDYACNAYCTEARTCSRSYYGCGDAGRITYNTACPDYDAGPDLCPTYDNCTTCSTQSSCGYCTNVNACRKGQSSGPNDGTCGLDAGWTWISSGCPRG